MSSDSSWWIWIGFILIFLFNVFRKVGGRSAEERTQRADEEIEKEKEEPERELRLSEMLRTLREAARTQAPAPRPSSPNPETRDRAASRAHRTTAPAHRPSVSTAPPPRPPTAAVISELLPYEEGHPDLREALAFSDDPLIQGIVISEMLSPPVCLRPPERLV